MKKLLLLIVIAAHSGNAQTSVTIPGYGQHETFDAASCIKVTVSSPSVKVPLQSKTVDVIIINECGVKFLVARINLKYIDKEGFRIGSDSDDAGIFIPTFAVAEKVKKSVALPLGATSAELREIMAIK